MVLELPKLPYDYDALEPYIDKETMQIHHDKHHQAYLDKFLAAIKDYPELQEKPVEEILSNLNNISDQIKPAVINHGGGFYNHSIFWEILSKDKPFDKNSDVGNAIIEKFESFENFKEQFSSAAATQFGSGWAWLTVDKSSKQLEIIQTKNQESSVSQGKIPILGIDVWEHAYYLKYQNQRPKYIEAFFNIINWEKVEELFVKAKEQ